MTVLTSSLLWPGPAGAAPRPSLEQVKAQMEALEDQAEVATEKFNATRDQIATLNLQLAASQQRVAAQQKAVAQAQAALGQIAVDTYKAGDLATLSLFFTSDPDRYLSANDLFVSLSDRRADAVQTLTRERQQLVGGMTDQAAQQEKLAEAQAQLKAEQDQVQARLAEAKALFGRLTLEERERLSQLRAGSDRLSLKDLGITMPASGRLTCQDVPVVIPPGRVGKVISYACAHIGDPYLWGGAGPKAFDCSGLTMMAWAQAGVTLPHNAAAQAEMGTRVSRGQLQPGDIVFFHSPISHDALYLGGGLMLHAPQTGDVVKIVPLRQDMVAAVRL